MFWYIKGRSRDNGWRDEKLTEEEIRLFAKHMITMRDEDRRRKREKLRNASEIGRRIIEYRQEWERLNEEATLLWFREFVKEFCRGSIHKDGSVITNPKVTPEQDRRSRLEDAIKCEWESRSGHIERSKLEETVKCLQECRIQKDHETGKALRRALNLEFEHKINNRKSEWDYLYEKDRCLWVNTMIAVELWWASLDEGAKRVLLEKAAPYEQQDQTRKRQ